VGAKPKCNQGQKGVKNPEPNLKGESACLAVRSQVKKTQKKTKHKLQTSVSDKRGLGLHGVQTKAEKRIKNERCE